MRITHKQDKSEERYRLDPNGEIINNVKNIKYLGFTISYDLSWCNDIHEVVNKANRVLDLIKRLLGPNSAPEFPLLYKSLVKLILGYAAPVWSRYLLEKSSKRSLETSPRPEKWRNAVSKIHYVDYVELASKRTRSNRNFKL